MNCRITLAFAIIGCLCFSASIAQAATLTLDMTAFVGASPASQFNGQSITADGFTLSSLLNGTPDSQLAIAGNGVVEQGLGVGTNNGTSVGFTRSINNNGTDSEAIDLEIGASAGGGLYEYLTAVAVANFHDSIVVIEGFADDPGASASNGTVGYSGGVLTWEGPLSVNVETVTFSNPAATPIGTTLRFSNGQTSASLANNGNSQYGLRSISFEAVPEPSAMLLATMAICGAIAVGRRKR